MKFGTFRSRKAMMSRARCASAPSYWKTKPHPGISGICLTVYTFLARKLSRLYLPFTLTPGSKMDFSAAINKLLFKRYEKMNTFLFNKVLRWQWHDWGEIENVYIAYNFSYFLIYTCEKLMEIWQSSDRNNLAQFFSETRCISNILYGEGARVEYTKIIYAWDFYICLISPSLPRRSNQMSSFLVASIYGFRRHRCSLYMIPWISWMDACCHI